MGLKFITLNLWLGGVLFNRVAEFINKEQPDILLLQEAHKGVQKKLNFKYFDFAPTFVDEKISKITEYGNAILSRYPIIFSRAIFYDLPYRKFNLSKTVDFSSLPRNLQHAVIQVNNINLNIYNTQGIWGSDGQDNKRRLNMSKIIINEIKNKDNVVLAGDFNVLPTTKTIKNIEDYLHNVFHEELTSTFNLKRKKKGEYATAVVDMIFVSKKIKVLNRYCPAVDISDHLPLVCTFEK